MERVATLIPNPKTDLRTLRQFRHFFERLIPFIQVAFSSEGLGSSVGRRLIVGKLRRIVLCLVPAWAESLQKRHGISQGCTGCGTSCNLLFQCPHWDASTRLCTVYEDRPNVCKMFPITPADIRDRDLIANHACGFKFRSE